MKFKPIIWKQSKLKFSSSVVAHIGPIKVGSVSYDGTTSASEKKKYKAFSNLPNVIQPKENFITEEEGKIWVENRFKLWSDAIVEEE